MIDDNHETHHSEFSTSKRDSNPELPNVKPLLQCMVKCSSFNTQKYLWGHRKYLRGHRKYLRGHLSNECLTWGICNFEHGNDHVAV
jgi:hypothetical protein